MPLFTKVEPERTGHDILGELNDYLASKAAEVDQRDKVVEARLQTLEREQKALRAAKGTISKLVGQSNA